MTPPPVNGDLKHEFPDDDPEMTHEQNHKDSPDGKGGSENSGRQKRESIGGRQRGDGANNYTAESEALDQIAKQAEERLAARRQARYEARNIRLKELEKKQAKEEQENAVNSNNVYPDGVRIREERRREATKNLGSRRSSTDSSEDGFNLNVRDLKNELRDVEEKFKKAMVANAGLDNDKAQLTYQVEALKDTIEEGEEKALLLRREMREKTRELEVLKKGLVESKRSVELLQMQLDEQGRLLAERGLVLVGPHAGDDEEEGVDELEQERRTRAVVSAETAAILAGVAAKGPLDARIKKLAEERDDLQDTVRRLKLDFEEERSRTDRLERSAPFTEEEADWETKKMIDDYKFRVQKAEQDMTTMAANVARLESQVVRYRTASETAERAEEELKTERRKLQRELREATSKVEELETANKHLETRLGKLKTAKSNLLKEL